MHGARADLGVPGLVDQAAALGPVRSQLEDHLLQRHAHAPAADVAEHAQRAQLALEVARRSARGGTPPARAALRGPRAVEPRRRPGGRRRSSSARAALRQHGAGGGPAVRAHEAVRGARGSAARRRAAPRRRRRSGRAAGTGRAAAAARPPGSARAAPAAPALRRVRAAPPAPGGRRRLRPRPPARSASSSSAKYDRTERRLEARARWRKAERSSSQPPSRNSSVPCRP